MVKLNNEVAIITGAQSGIGRETALALARYGADIVVNYIECEQEALDVVRLVERLGRGAAAFRADVSDANAVQQMVDFATSRFGRIDILVNNAAISTQADLVQETEANWEKVIRTNLKGPFLCCQKIAPAMIKAKNGRIVNISSICSFQAWRNALAYSVSKAGLNMLTKTLARELACHNITVNAIAPGPVDTAMLKRDLKTQEREAIRQKIPLGRLGKPEDIAELVAFLASPAASWITGEIITIDGGYTIVGDI